MRYIVSLCLTALMAGVLGATPDMQLERPANVLRPHTADDYLGNLSTTLPTTVTYTIRNAGTTDLILTGGSPVSLTSVINCTASVSAQPGSGTITAGGTTTFDLSVQPANSSAFSFTLLVESNDTAQNPYNLNVSGQTGAAEPVIEVRRAGTTIAIDGQTAAPYWLGYLSSGNVTTYDFEIHNLGTDVLILTTTPYVVTYNPYSCTPSVSAQPATAQVYMGEFVTFTLEVTSNSDAVWVFGVSIENNDLNWGRAMEGNTPPTKDKEDGGGGCVIGPSAPIAPLAAFALLAGGTLRRRRRNS